MNDITFSYNANFFLFATLESARPIAQGRVPQTQSAFPVLTGAFASGMAYLDRPEPAGYFLFPDLSVRNEGRYRLSFNLYEDPKEAKDVDAETAPDQPSKIKMPGPNATKVFVDWRLEVKSKPFTVFSAKKFPGLAESTVLSRIVAEQGCRVRIRRDVRMRRRETKGGADFDEYEDEAEYSRNQATPTPDPYQQNAAVAAGGPYSVEAPNGPSAGVPTADPTSYGADPQRRPSLHERASYGRPPHPQAYASAHLMPQGSPDGYPTLAYGAPLQGVFHPTSYPHPSQLMVQGPQMNYLHGMPHQQHQASGSASSHEGADPLGPSRRGSVSYPQAQAPVSSTGAAYAFADKRYPLSGPPAPQQYVGVAPAPSVPRTSTPGTSTHPLPPLKVPVAVDSEPSASASTAPTPSDSHHTAPSAVPSDGVRSGKRPYGSVFNASQYDQSLRHGMRPREPDGAEPSKNDLEVEEDEDFSELQRLRMQYKRADGTEISRRLPAQT